MVDLREIIFPWQMRDAEILMLYQWRIRDNLRDTKHPSHHKTASGVIVEPDPTLEYYRKRLRANPQYRQMVEDYERELETHLAQQTDIPPAVPVDRAYYGHDPYAGR